MKKKLRSSRGMTLTELLMALLIVSLIGVALTVGVNSAVKVYRDSTQLYESETLCGTILTCLEDEFRFSRNIRVEGTAVRFDSRSFGSGVQVLVNGDGKILIGESEPAGYPLLGNASYTSGLKVLKSEIAYSDSTGQVTIQIAVGPRDGDVYAQHEVTVAPLAN